MNSQNYVNKNNYPNTLTPLQTHASKLKDHNSYNYHASKAVAISQFVFKFSFTHNFLALSKVI